jgi:hypothetical protein
VATAKKFARSDDFKTPPCRLSFAQNLFKPRAAQDGAKTKYGCTLIFAKEHRAALEKHVAAVIREQWGDKGIERAKQGLIKSPFLAGDGKEARNKESGELHPGMGPDVFFVRTSANEDRPPVVRYKDPNIPATPEDVYSGCRGFAVINAFAWHNDQNGDGVSFGIQYFQKTEDDERIGGSGQVDPEKWFEKIDDTGDAPEETKTGAGAGGLFG